MDWLRAKWQSEVARQLHRWVTGEISSYFEIRTYLSSSNMGLPLLLSGKVDLFLGRNLSYFKTRAPACLTNTALPSSANSYAVVVTFMPSEATLLNLCQILEQFSYVVIIDNTPVSPTAFYSADAFKKFENFNLFYNHNKNGLAGAINLGLRFLSKHFPAGWIFWFDQDSCITTSFLSKVSESMIALTPAEISTTLFGVNYTATKKRSGQDGLIDVNEVITSGSFMRIENLFRIGLYIDELFIDSLDHEYCLRARRLGFSVKLLGAQLMNHSLGNSVGRVLPWCGEVAVTHHSALRWYYFMQNFNFVSFEGLPRSLPFAIRHGISLIKNMVKVIAYEDDKLVKFWESLRGAIAGLLLFFFGPRSGNSGQ